jgi:hypothetical protein
MGFQGKVNATRVAIAFPFPLAGTSSDVNGGGKSGCVFKLMNGLCLFRRRVFYYMEACLRAYCRRHPVMVEHTFSYSN